MAWLSQQNCSAQNTEAPDSALSNSHSHSFFVDIERSKPIDFSNTNNIRFPQQNLSNFLSKHTTSPVRNYSPPGIASISMRGADAAHTQILWNGFPINNVMLGSTDLSFLRSGFFEIIGIDLGNNSTHFGNGSNAGSIYLNSMVPAFPVPDFIYLQTELGTMKMFSNSVGISKRLKIKKIGFAIAQFEVIQFHSKNNFSYQLPNDNTRFYNKNADQNTLQYKFTTYCKIHQLHHLSFFSEAIQNNRKLPDPAEFNQIDKKKYSRIQDLNTRNAVEYKYENKKIIFRQRVGHFTDKLIYSNEQTQTIDTGAAENLISQTELVIYNKQRFQIYSGLDMQFMNAQHGAYKGNFAQFLPALFNFIHYTTAKKNTLLKLKQRVELYENQYVVELYLKQKVKQWKFDFSAGNLFRRPTFNDLYFNATEKRKLKNETGYQGEMRIEYSLPNVNNKPYELKVSNTTYYRHLRNNIKWLPQNNIWLPVNAYVYKTIGNLTDISIVKFLNSNNKKSKAYSGWEKIIVSLSYEYIHGQVQYKNSEKSYFPFFVPQNNGRFLLSLRRKHYAFNLILNYHSFQFTNTDNTEFINGYYTANFDAFAHLLNNKLVVHFELSNFTNNQYQIMPNRPMPGIQAQIKITYKIKLNK